MRHHQPKLFDYALGLRSKQAVRAQLRFETRQPHLHVSGRIPARRGCLTVELPLIEHPDRRNEIIVLDLLEDPTWLLDHNADQLRDWLYTPTESLPEGIPRVPFRTLRLNRCPMIAPYSLLDDAVAERWSIDRDALDRHQAIVDRWHDLVTLARDVFRDGERDPFVDPEHALYAGFVEDHDRAVLKRIRASADQPERWRGLAAELRDERQQALVFNARARHFPDSLDAAEADQWRELVRRRLTNPDWGASLTLAEALERTETLLAERPDETVLAEIKTWLQAQAERWLQQPPEQAAASKEKRNDDTPGDQTQLGLF